MIRIFCLYIAVLLLFASAVCAEVRTDILKSVETDRPVLDMATSADGVKAFVLVRGAVKVFSLPGGELLGTVAADESMDRIAGSPKGDLLLLGSSSGSSVSMVRLDFVNQIDISGAPVRGDRDARVTIVVFSDYQ